MNNKTAGTVLILIGSIILLTIGGHFGGFKLVIVFTVCSLLLSCGGVLIERYHNDREKGR